MAGIFINFDPAQVKAIRKQLADFPGAFSRVMVRTVNRVASAMRMKIAPILAERLGISAAKVKKRLWLKKATGRIGWARTRFGMIGFPAIWAGAKQTPEGVIIRRGVDSGKMIRSAFIATMKNPMTGDPQHKGVFLRRGKTRLKIDEQRTASVADVMSTSDIDRYEAEVDEMFAEKIVVETELILSGIRK